MGLDIGIIGGIVGFCLTVFGLWYKIDRDTNAKIDGLGKVFAAQLAEAQKQGDDKRARIYERLDTVKTAHKGDIDSFRKEIVDGFVPAKLCSLIHANAEKIFIDIKKELENQGKKIDILLTREKS